MSGSGLGKQLLLGFCFTFKAKKRYFKSVFMASALMPWRKSAISRVREGVWHSALFRILSQDPEEGERRERKWHKGLFKQFFFWFILKSVSFIKLLACERRRKEFFFLFFVGVTRSFLSIFQVQNLQIILKFYVFCALYIEYFCFLMSFIITVHSYPPSLINDRT